MIFHLLFTINHRTFVNALIIIKHSLSMFEYLISTSFKRNDMNIIILNLSFSCDVIIVSRDFSNNWNRHAFVILLLAFAAKCYCNSCTVAIMTFFVMLFFTWSNEICWHDLQMNSSLNLFTHCRRIVTIFLFWSSSFLKFLSNSRRTSLFSLSTLLELISRAFVSCKLSSLLKRDLLFLI